MMPISVTVRHFYYARMNHRVLYYSSVHMWSTYPCSLTDVSAPPPDTSPDQSRAKAPTVCDVYTPPLLLKKETNSVKEKKERSGERTRDWRSKFIAVFDTKPSGTHTKKEQSLLNFENIRTDSLVNIDYKLGPERGKGDLMSGCVVLFSLNPGWGAWLTRVCWRVLNRIDAQKETVITHQGVLDGECFESGGFFDGWILVETKKKSTSSTIRKNWTWLAWTKKKNNNHPRKDRESWRLAR